MSNKKKTCVFCGKTAGNAEHVFPDWLSKEFGQRDSKVVMEQDGGVSRTWNTRIFQATVKSVCRECNNGWMAEVEGNVSGYLGGMATGKKLPVKLDAKMQKDLGIWAQKTLLVNNSTFAEAGRNATKRMFEEIYKRKDIMLLSATFLGFNESAAEADGRTAGVRMNQIASVQCSREDEQYFRDQMDEGRRLIVGTIKLGRVTFCMIAGDFENASLSFSAPGDFIQVIAPTPQADEINWPTTIPGEVFGGWENIHNDLLNGVMLERNNS